MWFQVTAKSKWHEVKQTVMGVTGNSVFGHKAYCGQYYYPGYDKDALTSDYCPISILSSNYCKNCKAFARN